MIEQQTATSVLEHDATVTTNSKAIEQQSTTSILQPDTTVPASKAIGTSILQPDATVPASKAIERHTVALRSRGTEPPNVAARVSRLLA